MSAPRILMISHDHNGISKTSRALRLASHIGKSIPDASILILSDLPIIGKFQFTHNVDFVHLPGLVLKNNDEFHARKLNIHLKKALRIRHKITQSTAKVYKPHLIHVEAEPGSIGIELAKTISSISRALPKTKISWGFSDVLGNPESVNRIWHDEKAYEIMRDSVSEAWVYGDKAIYDYENKYDFPPEITKKLFYTGYLRSPDMSFESSSKELNNQQLKRPYILVNGGSGATAYKMCRSYLQHIEKAGDAFPYHSHLITGPLMPKPQRLILQKMVSKFETVTIKKFSKHLSQLMKFAEIIINQGGYNSICDILSYENDAILAPMAGRDSDDYHRIKALENHKKIHVLDVDDDMSTGIGNLIQRIGTSPEMKTGNLLQTTIDMNGLDAILSRVRVLTNFKGDIELKNAV